MNMEGLLIGGPYCGAKLPAAERNVFVWVGGSAKQPRGFKGYSATRHLYRSLRRDGGQEQFIYAGHTHRLCGSCGGFSEVRSAGEFCALCGAGKLARSAS